MNFCKIGRAGIVAAMTSFLFLSGCLSKETPVNGVSADDPITQNSAPVISGNPPAAVKVGEPYLFVPQATDTDGDILTFSIQNRPAWADFDSNTGQISGTPTLGDIGSYASIQVSVSDGQVATSMRNFTVDVTQIATASISLNWVAPTQNVDGSMVTNLAGFNIYYGQAINDYPNEISIDNPSISSYAIENLTLGDYFIVATAVNLVGEESAFSNVIVRTAL